MTFSWEHPEGIGSPLVRVGLHYGEELAVSARILPGVQRSLIRFLENLTSLEREGSWERRVLQSSQGEFEITSYLARVCGGGGEMWVVRCEFSLASDWGTQDWVVRLLVDIEFSRLASLASQFRDFFAAQGDFDPRDDPA